MQQINTNRDGNENDNKSKWISLTIKSNNKK